MMNRSTLLRWGGMGGLALQFFLSPAAVLEVQARPWQPSNWGLSQRIPQGLNNVPPPPPGSLGGTNPQINYPVTTPVGQVALGQGTRIQAAYGNADRIVVAPDETLPITLTVTENLVDTTGRVLIPAGSQVTGRLQPVAGGTQFVAETLTFQRTGQTIALNAQSGVINRQEEIRSGTNVGRILGGALIGAAAASAIDLVVGDGKVGIGTVLIGAALGAGTGWLTEQRSSTTVLVVNSQEDLDLTLAAPLWVPSP